MTTDRWLLASCVLGVLFLSGRAPGATAATGQVVMGTVLEVVVEAATPTQARQLADEAIAVARHWDDVLSTFRPEAELARLHRWRSRRIYASLDLLAALHRMEMLVEQTSGAFNPAYAAQLLPRHAGDTAVELGRAWVRLGSEAEIDPGAIGKGMALDAIVQWLQRRGAHEVFLNFGGSSFAHAAQASYPSRRRKVLLASARGIPLAIVSLQSASLSVSVSGSRDGARPIYEPDTGVPVPPGRVAAAVAREATSADAWSTALVVLGRAGLELARSHGIEGFVADHESAAWTEHFPFVPLQPFPTVSQEGPR